MSLDATKNFAKVTASTGYSSGATSVVLNSGQGALLPAAPFNMTWWNSTDYADPADDPNVEIVRVTAVVTDTLTVTRAQEGTSASSKNTAGKTYKMIAGITSLMISSISASSLGGYIVLQNSKMVNVNGNGLASGTTDLYTAPAGRRAFLSSGYMFNTAGSNVSGVWKLKSGGSYYQLNNSTLMSANTQGSATLNIVLEPGESISITTTAIGLNAWARITEYDSTVGMYSPRITSMASGNNTLYTAPSGKSASFFGGSFFGYGIIYIYNGSGGTVIYTPYIVPTGGSSGTGNQSGPAVSAILNSITSFFGTYECLSSGDSIVINSNSATAGQFAYAVVMEM